MNDECIICMEFHDGERYRLECKHEYHKSCLLKWMRRSNTCPLCRTETRFVVFIDDIELGRPYHIMYKNDGHMTMRCILIQKCNARYIRAWCSLKHKTIMFKVNQIVHINPMVELL
jgi:hypothetical protein